MNADARHVPQRSGTQQPSKAPRVGEAQPDQSGAAPRDGEADPVEGNLSQRNGQQTKPKLKLQFWAFACDRHSETTRPKENEVVNILVTKMFVGIPAGTRT